MVTVLAGISSWYFVVIVTIIRARWDSTPNSGLTHRLVQLSCVSVCVTVHHWPSVAWSVGWQPKVRVASISSQIFWTLARTTWSWVSQLESVSWLIDLISWLFMDMCFLIIKGCCTPLEDFKLIQLLLRYRDWVFSVNSRRTQKLYFEK